jgi:hypothetical protein
MEWSEEGTRRKLQYVTEIKTRSIVSRLRRAMRAIFGDEAVDSDPHLRTRAAPRGPPGRKLPDVPYFLVVFTVLDEERKSRCHCRTENIPSPPEPWGYDCHAATSRALSRVIAI